MSRLKLGKPAKTLLAVIESEGATIIDKRKGGNHLQVDYTFDHQHFFTASLPFGTGMSQRWATQLRQQLRRNKENKSS